MNAVLRKIFTILAYYSLVVQFFSPLSYFVPATTYAQEVTATPTVTPAPVDTITPTPMPTAVITPTPTPTETPQTTVTPVPTDTPAITPTDTTTPVPTNTATPVPSDTTTSSNVSSTSTPLVPTITPVDTVSPTSVVSPAGQDKKTGKEQVNFTILKNTNIKMLDLQTPNLQSSATLTTDKADYAPTDIAFITGNGLMPNAHYTLFVSSTDPPPVNFSTGVTSDNNGTFTYAYQLDGTYRPNYSVTLKDAAGAIVASTTFTDTAIPSSVQLYQWETDPSGSWITGNLGSGNSNYTEGETVPFRLDVDGLATSGNPYTFSICRDVSSGTKKGYTTLLPFNTSRAATAGGSITSTSGAFSGVNVTINSATDVGQGACGSGQIETQVSFTSTNNSMQNVLWGGRLASPADAGVGAGNGAASFPGASLHMKLLSPNKDRSINPGAIIELAQITVSKTVDTGSANPNSWCFNISPDPNSQSGTVCGPSGIFTGLPTGSYTITESSVSGYSFASGNGTNCTFSSSTATASIATGTTATNATCNFHNAQQTGSITIVKDAVPNDPQDFAFTAGGGLSPASFSLDDDSDPTLSNTKVFSNLAAGTYSVSEGGVTGWTQTSATCSDGSPVSAISLQAGENVTCTFTNTKQATVVVQKNTIGGNWTFNFTGTGANGFPGSFEITTSSNTGSQTYSVTPGVQYSVSETVPSGWDLISSSCTSGTPSSFTPTAGQTITCTFNNTKKGHLIVQKTTVPGGDQTVFTINASSSNGGVIANGGAGTVTDSTDKDYEVTPGTYSVAETVPAGWSKTGDVCQNVPVAAGQTVKCLLTNTKLGTIIVKKIMVGGTGSFTFTGDANGTIATNNGTITVNNVLPGTYASVEGAATGWDLNSIVCDDTTNGGTASTGDVNSRTATFNVDAGEAVTCTFTNTKRGHLLVTKVTDPSSDTTTQFSITASGNGTISGNATQTIVGGQTVDYEVTPGTYSVAEAAKTGWDTGNDCVGKVVAAGQSVTCTITNTQRGSITVIKYHDHDASGTKDNGDEVLSGWTINLASNSGTANQNTDNNGQVVFGNLIPGSYDLSEIIKDNWFQSNISCTGDTGIDKDNDHPIRLSSGQNINCVIGNYQKGQIKVVKDVVAPDGSSVTDTSTNFAFSVDGGSTFNLTDGQNNSVDVTPGPTHTVIETPNSNYTFAGCVSDPASGLTTDSGITVPVSSGQIVTVTCTNKQKPAKITVNKIVEDSSGKTTSDTANFTVQLNNADPKTIAQPSTSAVYTPNPGGPYTIAETGVDTSKYEVLGCKIFNETPATEFNLSSNQEITVTCTNKQKPGTISGFKYKADGTTGILGWTVNLLSCVSGFSSCPTVLGTRTTDASGFYSFTNLVTGFYRVAEALDSLFTPTTVTSHDVTISPGTLSTVNAASYNFSNFKNVNLTVCKKSDNDGSLETTNDQAFIPGWGMTLYSDGKKVGDSQVTNSDGCYAFQNLGPNHDYSVTEETRPGWTNLNPVSHDFGVAADGQDQRWTFINYPHGSITVHKMVDVTGNGTFVSGDDGDFTWTLDGTGANVMGSTDSNVTVGQHSVGESDVTNFHFVSWYPTGGLNADENPYTCNSPFSKTLPISVNVGANGTSDFTICNARDTGKITVNKVVNPSEGDSGLFNLQIDGNTAGTGANVGNDGTTGTVTVLTGTHSTGEVAGTDTFLSNYISSISCVDGGGDGEEIAATDGNGTSLSGIQVNKDDDIVCTITNTRKGKIIVTKYNDLNGDGKLQDGEGILAGWTINLTGQTSQRTSSNGQAVFDNLVPNEYILGENVETGWKQTNISCPRAQTSTQEDPNKLGVFVSAGQTVNCSILNHSVTPVLTIAKTNNAVGNKVPGDSVGYTLTLALDKNGGSAEHVNVIDLLPKGFVYNSGSYQVLLTDAGGTTTDITSSIAPPTYHSPGTWVLGNAKPGDVFTLKYIATIDGSQQPGTYYDTALGQGTALGSADTIFASAIIPGKLDSTFVGTDVNVVKDQQSGISIAINKKEGEVLGASTEALPGTGAHTIWAGLALASMFIGLTFATIGLIIRKRYV